VSKLVFCVLLVLAVFVSSCGRRGDDDDDDSGLPECPEGDIDMGNACTEQSQCERPYCARLGGICVDYTWVCGSCGFCFFQRIDHTENTFMACNGDIGLCEAPEEEE
jgi:hypothetical protein